jgi:hypothetical protein
MPRKITTGKVGGPILGSISATDNTLATVEANVNLKFSPNGTGITEVDSHIQLNAESALRLADSDSSRYVAFKSPATVSSNVTWTLPDADAATAGNALTSNGSGTLSWTDVTTAVNQENADGSNTYYPTLTRAQTSGSLDDVYVADSKLSFAPNTGTLTATSMSMTTGSTSGNFGCGGTLSGNSITSSGNITASTGTISGQTITETSSIVLKENVNPLVDAIEKVLKLDGVTYTRKSTGQTETGLIAEEVEKIAPELVEHTGEHKSIQYSRLTAYLIESVKYLKDELDKVKNG